MSGDPIKEIKKELYLMTQKTREMLEFAENAFSTNKLASLDQADELAKEIHAKEDALIEKLAKEAASSQSMRSIVSVPGQIEKAAAMIKRITDNIRVRVKEGMLFSDKAIQETGKLFTMMNNALKKAGDSIVSGSPDSLKSVIADLDAIEALAAEFTTAHENRIISGEASPKSSTVFLCILYAFDEMAGYIKNALSKSAV